MDGLPDGSRRHPELDATGDTRGTTELGSYNPDREYDGFLSEIWHAAVKEAEPTWDGLNESYRNTIQKFDSHDSLIQELEARIMDADSEMLHGLLQNLAAFNLLIGRLNISEACTEEREQIRTIIHTAFIQLIDFWVQAGKMLESSQVHASGEMYRAFEKSVRHLKSSIDMPIELSVLDNCYSQVQQAMLELQTAMLLVPTYDQDPVEYPVTLLPEHFTNPAFHGRDEVLTSIEDFFEEGSSAPPLRSVLLHGTGGVGKTETAMNFAHTRRGKYDVILWIRSETPLSLSTSMAEIARSLSFPGSDSPGSDERNLSRFHEWVNNQAVHVTGRRWLFIYDDIQAIDDNLKRYIPTTPGDIILTSRNRLAAYEQTKIIPMKPFSKEVGGQLLRKLMQSPEIQLATDDDMEATTCLARMVDGLALGIQYMAGLMNESDEESASDFMKFYTESPRGAMMGAPPADYYDKDLARLPDEEHPLDRIWATDFAALAADKRTLLGIASFLDPERIQQYLFGPTTLKDKPAEMPNLALMCGPPSKIDIAIVGLVNVALADRNSDCFSIPRLVQEAFRYWCGKDEVYEHFTVAVHIVHQFFPRQVNGRPMHESWDKCRELIQHGQVLAERFDELQTRFPELEAPAKLAELLKDCGWYLFEMGDHPTALDLLDTAIKACLDEQSETYANLLNTIGSCSFELSNLKRCRQVWDRALAIRETWAKKKPPGAEEEWANQLNNYGNLESAEGNYGSALEYFSRAKEIRLRLGNEVIAALGVTHMTTGRALCLMGKYEEAIAEYKNAESIFLHRFGKDTHFMAHLNYAYGNLEFARNDTATARGFYTEAHRILERDTPTHLLLAASYYKLAILSGRDDNDEEALVLLDKGLNIAELRGGKGDAARIMCKKAAILSTRDSSEDQNASNALRRKVEGIVRSHFQGTISALESGEEKYWNVWVCPYWR